MADFKKLTVKGEALQAKLSAEESESSPKTRRSPRKSNDGLKGCIPLALLPKIEGGQGMRPSSIPNLYRNQSGGGLFNSQGMGAAEYDCVVCFDAHVIKIDPRDIGRASEGAWHWLRVPCPNWDKETKRCAV